MSFEKETDQVEEEVDIRASRLRRQLKTLEQEGHMSLFTKLLLSIRDLTWGETGNGGPGAPHRGGARKRANTH